MEVSKNQQQNNSETVKIRMMKIYLKKDIFRQEKDKKLFIN